MPAEHWQRLKSGQDGVDLFFFRRNPGSQCAHQIFGEELNLSAKEFILPVRA